VAFVMYWIAKGIAGRVLGKVLERSGRGDTAERGRRAETLRRVFDSTAGVVIIVFGIITALNQAGVNVTVLLGGAAVIGAAIAFGSQNLIKDYFSGFMILMENQYSVGNVVKVGAVTGTVENITLRMTSLRDLEGVLHFIPHSQVLSVSNLTYGWSRIVMDIKVSVSEDPDKVMEMMLDVVREMKRDEQFGPQILGDPEMLGVDSIGAAAMVIKVLVKTKPLHRWPVKREMLRRMKKKFDAAGVKIA
jgi:moderate conductance mechanosensitive channel